MSDVASPPPAPGNPGDAPRQDRPASGANRAGGAAAASTSASAPRKGTAVRWWVLGVVISCIIVSAVGFIYSYVAATTPEGEQRWRQRELANLAAAHDRVEADMAQGSSAGAAARRSVQRSILQRMATVAKPMPNDAIPDNIKALLSTADLSDEAKADPAPPIVATAPPVAPPTDAGAGSGQALGAGTSPGDNPPTGYTVPEKTVPAPADPAPAAPVVVAATQPAAPPPAEPTPVDPAQLADALNAEKTDRGQRVKLPAEALFGAGQDALDPAADLALTGVLELAKRMQPREIVVVGYGDASGKRDAEFALSKKRASAVSGWLKDHGVSGQEHLTARAAPPTRAADRSDDSEEPAQGARIEILLRRK